MVNDSIYNDENINGIRVSKLIVDVASDILRDRLVDVIKSKSRDLNKADTQSYASLEDYLSKNQRNFHSDAYFYSDQLKNMYPGNKPVKTCAEFDLTLCLNLFRRLLHPPGRQVIHANASAVYTSPWSTEPSYNDTTLAANLVRLKIIRDLNYGHIHRSLSLRPNQMERLGAFENAKCPRGCSLVAKLEYAIYSMCKSEEQRVGYKAKINACLEQPISDPNVVDRYKELIRNLVAKDRDTTALILRQVEFLNITDEKILKIDKNNYEKIKTSMRNLFKMLDKMNVNYEQLVNKMYDISPSH